MIDSLFDRRSHPDGIGSYWFLPAWLYPYMMGLLGRTFVVSGWTEVSTGGKSRISLQFQDVQEVLIPSFIIFQTNFRISWASHSVTNPNHISHIYIYTYHIIYIYIILACPISSENLRIFWPPSGAAQVDSALNRRTFRHCCGEGLGGRCCWEDGSFPVKMAVINGDSWWLMVIHGDSWWFMMVNGD